MEKGFGPSPVPQSHHGWLFLTTRGLFSLYLKVVQEARRGPLWELAQLLLGLEVPAANSRGEQAIGRFRVRAKEMRGISMGRAGGFVLQVQMG